MTVPHEHLCAFCGQRGKQYLTGRQSAMLAIFRELVNEFSAAHRASHSVCQDEDVCQWAGLITRAKEAAGMVDKDLPQ